MVFSCLFPLSNSFNSFQSETRGIGRFVDLPGRQQNGLNRTSYLSQDRSFVRRSHAFAL